MAYNEFLQNGIEGGIVGCLLLVLLLGSLLLFKMVNAGRINVSRNLTLKSDMVYVSAYAGVAAFGLMSFFNFTIQAIPVMALFVIYSGVICAHPSLKRYAVNKKRHKVIGAFLIVAGSVVALITVTGVYYNLLNKDAKCEAAAGSFSDSIEKLEHIGDHLNTNNEYWMNYGNVLLAQHDYPSALAKFERAEALSSDPNLYMKSAQCRAACQDLLGAKNDLLIANCIDPNRISPKYALMQILLEMRDTAGSVSMAHDILTNIPKINSAKNVKYQQAAQNMLNILDYRFKADEGTSPITVNTPN